MCVVSMVMDDFNDRFRPWIDQPINPPLPQTITVTDGTSGAWLTSATVAELRQLIQEFKEAVAAAKTVDRLTKQPDCQDPEKIKLVERVAELEKQLAKHTKKKARKPRAAKKR